MLDRSSKFEYNIVTMLYENFEFKNTRYQGNAGLGAAIAYYTMIGYDVSLPLTDSTYYDLIIDDGDRLYKVQCKTASYKSPYGSYVVTMATQGGNQSYNYVKAFDASRLDFVFILTSDGRWYNIPSEAANVSTKLTLSEDKDKYIVNGDVRREFVEDRLITERQMRRRKHPSDLEPGTTKLQSPKPRPKKIDWPPTEELLQRVEEKGYSAVGRELGVSDNAVRKHLRTHTSHPSK